MIGGGESDRPVGRYGNVDDGMPLVKDGGPANAHSIGGDKVSFISPKSMTVHSDRRTCPHVWKGASRTVGASTVFRTPNNLWAALAAFITTCHCTPIR